MNPISPFSVEFIGVKNVDFSVNIFFKEVDFFRREFFNEFIKTLKTLSTLRFK